MVVTIFLVLIIILILAIILVCLCKKTKNQSSSKNLVGPQNVAEDNEAQPSDEHHSNRMMDEQFSTSIRGDKSTNSLINQSYKQEHEHPVFEPQELETVQSSHLLKELAERANQN